MHQRSYREITDAVVKEEYKLEQIDKVELDEEQDKTKVKRTGRAGRGGSRKTGGREERKSREDKTSGEGRNRKGGQSEAGVVGR